MYNTSQIEVFCDSHSGLATWNRFFGPATVCDPRNNPISYQILFTIKCNKTIVRRNSLTVICKPFKREARAAMSFYAFIQYATKDYKKSNWKGRTNNNYNINLEFVDQQPQDETLTSRSGASSSLCGRNNIIWKLLLWKKKDQSKPAAKQRERTKRA